MPAGKLSKSKARKRKPSRVIGLNNTDAYVKRGTDSG
jgi:hypothetical protein